MTTLQPKRVKTGVSFTLTCITAQADQNHGLQLQCGQTILNIEKANKDVEQSRDYFESEKKKEEARMTNFQRAGEPRKNREEEHADRANESGYREASEQEKLRKDVEKRERQKQNTEDERKEKNVGKTPPRPQSQSKDENQRGLKRPFAMGMLQEGESEREGMDAKHKLVDMKHQIASGNFVEGSCLPSEQVSKSDLAKSNADKDTAKAQVASPKTSRPKIPKDELLKGSGQSVGIDG